MPGSKCLFATALIAWLLACTGSAQNPPLSGDPYLQRGKSTSPDGKYEWRVYVTDEVRYQLINLQTGKGMAAVNAYYPDPNSSNLHYAKAYGVFWNEDGTIVALDELNRRRAGKLYFFVLRGGMVSEIRSEKLIPLPADADEGRLVVDPGGVSSTAIRVRQAVKTRKGEFASRYFTIGFANPDMPEVEPAG